MKHYLATSTYYRGCIVIGPGWDQDHNTRFIIKLPHSYRYSDYRTNVTNPLRLMHIIRQAVTDLKAREEKGA